MTSAAIRLSSDKVRKPWATVPPNGVFAAASGSTWMNWGSSVDVGEGVDPRLVDQDPVGDADLGADLGLDLVDAGDGHGAGLERASLMRLKPHEADARR